MEDTGLTTKAGQAAGTVEIPRGENFSRVWGHAVLSAPAKTFLTGAGSQRTPRAYPRIARAPKAGTGVPF